MQHWISWAAAHSLWTLGADWSHAVPGPGPLRSPPCRRCRRAADSVWGRPWAAASWRRTSCSPRSSQCSLSCSLRWGDTAGRGQSRSTQSRAVTEARRWIKWPESEKDTYYMWGWSILVIIIRSVKLCSYTQWPQVVSKETHTNRKWAEVREVAGSVEVLQVEAENFITALGRRVQLIWVRETSRTNMAEALWLFNCCGVRGKALNGHMGKLNKNSPTPQISPEKSTITDLNKR